MTNEDLVQDIKKGVNVSENMEILYNSNIAFIKKIIYPYSNSNNLEDLLQESFIGLWEATKHYQPYCNAKFMTYASYWIKRAALEYIKKRDSKLLLPNHIWEMVSRYNKAFDQFVCKNMRQPSTVEIAEQMNISIEELDRIKKYVPGVLSLDEQLPDSEDYYVDTIKADTDIENDVIDKIYSEQEKKQLWDIVERCTSKEEYDTLRKKYLDKQSIKRIAEDSPLTVGQVRTLELNALKKLQKPKVKKEIMEKLEVIESKIYKTGFSRFYEDWESSVEKIALKKIDLQKKYAE